MTLPLSLIAVHFIADFVFQSDWMAINKSKRWDALALHVSIYAACFIWLGALFAMVTLGTHFVTDAVTSRITSALWQRNQRHWFFVAVGADQLIHYATLALTLRWLVGQ